MAKKQTRRHEVSAELIASALGFHVPVDRLTPAGQIMADRFLLDHELTWLSQCILWSAERAGLAKERKMTKPKARETVSEKELRVLAGKALLILNVRDLRERQQIRESLASND